MQQQKITARQKNCKKFATPFAAAPSLAAAPARNKKTNTLTALKARRIMPA
jgi:hypothetical protein